MPTSRSKRARAIAQSKSVATQQPANEILARSRVKKLWQAGELFHNFARFSHRPEMKKVDRLALILENGLVAPASCNDGTVRSDLNINVIGAPVPYDSLVFLHRFKEISGLYLWSRPDHFTVLVEQSVPFLTPKDMGKHWAMLSQDEVYVRDRIAPEHLSGLVVDHADVEEVMKKFLPRLQALGMPVYLMDGTVLWPEPQTPQKGKTI
jgi:hypothetical protein